MKDKCRLRFSSQRRSNCALLTSYLPTAAIDSELGQLSQTGLVPILQPVTGECGFNLSSKTLKDKTDSRGVVQFTYFKFTVIVRE